MSALSRIDIKQLRVLHGLLQERNLSRVANQLGVTQQAVSDQLKKLRTTLDDRLFIRTSNGVIPTPYAESLQPKIDHILKALEDLLTPDELDLQAINKTFTISSTDLEQVVILPHLVKILRREAPGVKLAIKKLELDQLASALLTGEVDLVISNPDFVPPNYPSQCLYVEEYCCVASCDNQQVKDEMTIAEIAQIPQLVVSPSRGDFTGAANQWFREQGHPRNVVLSVPTFTAAKACIAQSDLCGFIPSRLLPNANLKRITLDKNIPGFEVISVWHQRSSQDPLHRWIRDQLLKITDKKREA
ncbi:LysR family transcriptional regulator [Litoribacillus peritrichatus]|uniref:LysR family transcriptional regulator n=1 Tax=Litoribacillus peritrichatus TaxID=718191 RepID=A0ABP7ME67_9GAMM